MPVKQEVLAEKQQWAYMQALLEPQNLRLGMSMGTGHSSFTRKTLGGIGKGLRGVSRYPKTVMGVAAGGVGYMGYRNTRGSQNNPLKSLE